MTSPNPPSPDHRPDLHNVPMDQTFINRIVEAALPASHRRIFATPIAPDPTSASCSMSVTWMSPPVSVIPKTSNHGVPQRSSSSEWRAGGIAEHWMTRTR